MPYYVRAFCNSDTVPSVSELESILKAEYPAIRLETGDGRDGKWEQFFDRGRTHAID